MQSPRSESFFTMPKKTIDKNQANDPKTSRRWFVPSLIAAFLVLLIIVVAAIIFFSRRQPLITKKIPAGVSEKQKEDSVSLLGKSNIFSAKISPGSTNLNGNSPKKAKPTPELMELTGPADNENKSPAKARSILPNVTVDQPNSKSTSTVRNPHPETVASLKKSLQKRTSSKDAVPSKKAAAARSMTAGNPATKAKKANRTRSYDRIDDSKLKLQALAWFNNASKRMAVINSQIVREGGSVDGYQVTQIRQQDVLVSDGRKSWRLEFGLKQ